ncbi:uncharacterized protein RAG0_01612 [Rhynchosporium agropyri]|uniref:Uncharacterized protein n=1 Tax=Rhynchosporium agropyri TaxID=914238 RepID=A0A1E1JXX3_9HELO|nr:uncharacterized protein RAG0_01612 [Rhynchosporium agropyri]
MCSDLESTYSCGHSDKTRTYCTYYREPENKVLHYTDCRDYKGLRPSDIAGRVGWIFY